MFGCKGVEVEVEIWGGGCQYLCVLEGRVVSKIKASLACKQRVTLMRSGAIEGADPELVSE